MKTDTYLTTIPSGRNAVNQRLLDIVKKALDTRFTNNLYTVAEHDSHTLAITGPSPDEHVALGRDFVTDFLFGFYTALPDDEHIETIETDEE